MRILFSVHNALDRDAGASGATVRLAEALRRRGNTVDVISFSNIPLPDALKRYCFPWLVARHLQNNPGYDVADLSSGDGWVASAIMRAGGRKNARVVLARSHGLEHLFHEHLLRENAAGRQPLSWKYPIYNGGFRLWECRMAFVQADGAFFLNEEEKQYAIQHLGVPKSRAVVTRNGIAEYFIDKARVLAMDGRESPQPRNIVFIGNYLPRKGIEPLRQAMLKVLTAFPDTRLTYLGAGAQPSEVLTSYPTELHSQINVIPRYENERLPELLTNQHILLFPSLSEGFPIAPLEAMACGLVPIVTALPGPTSYIRDGHNGLVVPIGDGAALEAELVQLLQNGQRWVSLRRAALTTALGYDWDGIAVETERVYESCLMSACRANADAMHAAKGKV